MRGKSLNKPSNLIASNVKLFLAVGLPEEVNVIARIFVWMLCRPVDLQILQQQKRKDWK